MQLAAFGVGFRDTGGAAGKLTVNGSVKQPTGRVINPSFFYIGLAG